MCWKTFFSKKNQYICVSLDVNFNESLANGVVSFEQLGPGFQSGDFTMNQLAYLHYKFIKAIDDGKEIRVFFFFFFFFFFVTSVKNLTEFGIRG